MIHLASNSSEGDIRVAASSEDASQGALIVNDTDGEKHSVAFRISSDDGSVKLQLDANAAEQLTTLASIGVQCAATEYLDFWAATNGHGNARRAPVAWSSFEAMPLAV